MPLTKVSFSVIQVANNVTSTTVGNTTSIPSFTFDQNGVITSASNVTPSIANTQITGTLTGSQISSNTLANSVFQTGSVENYLRANTLDFGMRNRIINGAMRIDQRNSGAAVTPTDGQYTLDRWASWASASSKYTVQQDSSANTVAGFTSSLKVTSLSSYSVSSSDYFAVAQYIEGLNVADLGWGTANAKTVTLSFWVRSSLTGTFGGSINNSAYNRSYPFSYTISAANTWEQKTITVAGDTSGTWLTTNGSGIRVIFGLGMGSSVSGTAGSWTSSSFYSATGAVSVVGTNGATWYVTGVQLEEGSTPTPFEYRQYGTELALCQRYFQKHTGELFSSYGATINYLWWLYKVTMRATPTITGSTGTSLVITVDAATNYSTGAAYASFSNPTASAEL